MERRIKQAHIHRSVLHSLINAHKVTLLERQEGGQSLAAAFLIIGKNHFTHLHNAIFLKEHMLSTSQSDTLCAKVDGCAGITGIIGIGTHFHGAASVSPFHKFRKIAADSRRDSFNIAGIHTACGAVQRYVITFVEFYNHAVFAGYEHHFVFFINFSVLAACHTAGTHTAGNHCRVRSSAAAACHNTLGNHHTFDVFGRGFQTHQNHTVGFCHFLGVFRSEHNASGSSTGGGINTFGNPLGLLQRFAIKYGVQQSLQLLGFHTQNGFFFSDKTFRHHIHSHFESGGGSAFAVSGLQKEQLFILNGKFHILHIAVMIFQSLSNINKLLINFGHIMFQCADGTGCADTRHHIFALGVDKIFTVHSLFTGGRVASKGNPGTRGIAHITEHHHLHINSRTPFAGDFIHSSVNDGTGVIPRTEHSLYSFFQLHLRILREIFTLSHSIIIFESVDNILPVVRRQIHIRFQILLFFDFIKHSFKRTLGQLHHHIRKHLDKATV